MLKMAELFRVKDPKGIEVYCDLDQWNEHIILNHPIMKKNLTAIQETIQHPDSIYLSSDCDDYPPYENRRLYNKKESSATYYPRVQNTRVVVSISGGSGEVVTAYPCKSETSGSIIGEEAIYVAPESD